jgi:HAD superfamily hydrolase (TIGR01549 family)
MMRAESKASIRAVIFDCDGVILESRAANEAFYNAILAHFNQEPLTESQLAIVHCHTVHESLAMLFREDGLLQEAEKYWQEMNYEPFSALISVQPGLRECLEFLRPSYKLAIATSRTRTMDQVLEDFGLESYFDLVVTSQDVRNPKPHPESIDKILSHFNVKRREACFIGDSKVDLETSRRAGVVFIAYGTEELEAEYYLDHFSQLPSLLTRMCHELSS